MHLRRRQLHHACWGKSSELEKPPTNPQEPSPSLRNGKSGVVLIKIPINKIGNKCTRQSWVWKVFENWHPRCYQANIRTADRQRRPLTQIDHLSRSQGTRAWNNLVESIRVYNGNIKKLGHTSLKPAPRKEKIIWVLASELNILTLYINLNFSTHRIHSTRHMLMLSAAYSVTLSWKTSPRCCIEISQGVRPGDIHERKADFGIV